MNINVTSIGDELQIMNVYLDINDYVALFKKEKEVRFGALLRIYEKLGKIISEDEDRLREWVYSDSYKPVADTTNKVASIINNNGNTTDKELPDIYPLTVVKDRYNGTYSGGKYTAWKLYPWGIPEAVFGDDNSCWNYFRSTHDIYGRGDTPDEAVIDLKRRLDKLVESGKFPSYEQFLELYDCAYDEGYTRGHDD